MAPSPRTVHSLCPREPWRIGIDVGGTFTDLALIDADGRLFTMKSLSDNNDPAAGVLDCLSRSSATLGLTPTELVGGCDLFVHGSTVATNILLEQTGATVGLLTTEGFRDAIEIRRGIRRQPWDHRRPYPPVLVPRYLRQPVRERIDRHGASHTPLDESSVLEALDIFRAENVESVAICFLNSYLNPDHERRAVDIVRSVMPEVWVSASSDVIPLAGEYERQSTTVVDAYVAPRITYYLQALDDSLKNLGLRNPLLLVKNNGGTGTAEEIGRSPVALTLSGPAAVVGALRHLSEPLGTRNLISIEIGGTSTDAALMADGSVAVVDRLSISDYDLAIPSVEIHTIGAGGGTIAGTDRAGALFVGPRGAGARPGPAAYGFGGTDPTATDAQVVLGRLHPGTYAGGALSLDERAAEHAILEKVAKPLGLSVWQAAAGIVRLLEQRMLHAVRYISVQRGLDPGGFTLVAGGGAGGLHGCSVGSMLGCQKVYVPRLAGVLCAFGMLHSDVRHDLVRTFVRPLDGTDPKDVSQELDRLANQAGEALKRQGFGNAHMQFERAVDLRYLGQQWDVRVNLPAHGPLDWYTVRKDFEDEYERLFGHRQPEAPIEIVKLRVVGLGAVSTTSGSRPARVSGSPTPIDHREIYLEEASGFVTVPVYQGADLLIGHHLTGPLLIEEDTTTVLIGSGDRLDIDSANNFLVHLLTKETRYAA